MPDKLDRKPINNEKLDRRVKLTEKDKEEIKLVGDYFSQRELARMYEVSRRLIQFVLDPVKLEENKKRRVERGGSKIYYDKEKHTKAMREHRDYKKQLVKDGLL